jgi:hypothetical protein
MVDLRGLSSRGEAQPGNLVASRISDSSSGVHLVTIQPRKRVLPFWGGRQVQKRFVWRYKYGSTTSRGKNASGVAIVKGKSERWITGILEAVIDDVQGKANQLKDAQC